MHCHLLSRRSLAGVAVVACAAALTPAAALATTSSGAVITHASSANHPQRRQLAATTLSSFKVVLTATRDRQPGQNLKAAVTAAGYRATSHGWKLIATKRLGTYFWYSTEVCSLTVTQLKPEPSSAAPSDAMRVRLLLTPALGCGRPVTERWPSVLS
jgi:hypothetical protein